MHVPVYISYDIFILLMEGTEILLLLEEVLTGKIPDRKNFEKKTLALHKALVRSSVSFLRASSIISSRLNETKKIQEKNYKIFQKYINEALTDKKPTSLSLFHFPIPGESSKKAGRLVLEINKINNHMIALIHSSFSDLKLNACKELFTCKVRVGACARIIHKAKVIFSRILKSSLKIWSQNVKSLILRNRSAMYRGKHRDKIIKMSVFKRIVKNISLGFEPIAFFKWKIKINEYEEFKAKFIQAIKKTERYFKSIYLKRWKCFNADSRRKRRKLLENTLAIIKEHYSDLMIGVLNLLRDNGMIGKMVGKIEKKSNKALRSAKRINHKNLEVSSVRNLDQIKDKLQTVLKNSAVRYFYLKKAILKEFSSKIHPREEMKERKSTRYQSLKPTCMLCNMHSLTRQGSATEEANTIRRAFKTCALRYFFSKTVALNKWKNFKNGKNSSEVNEYGIIQRKENFSKKCKEVEEELDFTFDRITSHTTHLKKLTKSKRKVLLRSSKRVGTEINVKMSNLITKLCTISKTRKSFRITTLNKWKTNTSNLEHMNTIKLKCVFCFVKRKMMRNEMKKLAFSKWGSFTIEERRIDGNLILHQLALNAIEMKNSAKTVLNLWKQNHKKYYSDALKAKAKIVFRSMKKATRMRIKSALYKWKSETIPYKIKGIPEQKEPTTTIIRQKNKALRGINPKKLNAGANNLQNILAKGELRYFFCKLFRFKQWQSVNFDHSAIKNSYSAAYKSFQLKMKNTVSQLVEIYYSMNRFLTKKYFYKWKISSRKAEYYKTIQLKAIFRLIKRAMDNRTIKKKAVEKWVSVKNFIEESKTLQLLVTKAIEMKNSTKIVLKLWKMDIKKHRIHKNSSKCKIALRSFRKLTKAKIFSVLCVWKQAAAHAQNNKINKIVEMIRVLNCSLIKNCAKAFKVPTQLPKKYKTKSPSLTEQGIVKALRINIKILYCMLNSMFQKQLKFSFEALNHYKKLYKKTTRYRLSSILNLSGSFHGLEKSITDISNPSMTSTTVSARLSKDELVSVSQLGAVEAIGLNVRASLYRRMAWALTSVYIFTQNLGEFDEERGRLVEEINCLRYDKHSLLDDNTNLRLHNEALIENLERIDENCYILSCMLNKMKLSRMMNIITKMFDTPLLDTMLTMKINTEFATYFQDDYQ